MADKLANEATVLGSAVTVLSPRYCCTVTSILPENARRTSSRRDVSFELHL